MRDLSVVSAAGEVIVELPCIDVGLFGLSRLGFGLLGLSLLGHGLVGLVGLSAWAKPAWASASWAMASVWMSIVLMTFDGLMLLHLVSVLEVVFKDSRHS